jgi:hypothetical protein
MAIYILSSFQYRLGCPALREESLDPCSGFLKEVMIAPRAKRIPVQNPNN